MVKNKLSTTATRRKFLGGAAVAGAATIAMPQVSRAQTVTLKMQGSLGRAGHHQRIRQGLCCQGQRDGRRPPEDRLPQCRRRREGVLGDGRVPSSGVLDGGHTVPAYWYGKHRAASLFGTGPAYGFNGSQYMGWFYYGGGDRAVSSELTQDVLKLNVVGFYVFAFQTQPLGWFKKEISGPGDFKGLKYRTVGLASNVMQAMGASVAQLAWAGNPAGDGKGRHRRVRVQQPDLGHALRRAGRGQVLLHGLLPSGLGSH